MRVLLVGENGQLARAIQRRLHGHDLIVPGRAELDLAEPSTVYATLARYAPEFVINTGAYTAVDQAEDDVDTVFAINAAGPAALGAASKRIGSKLIQLSTDYVFDGHADRPYRVDDPVSPLGVYGRSKLAGEQAVLESGAKALVVRTSWVYSPFGKSFVKTMLALACKQQQIRVVADQAGSPTSALDLADALIAIVNRWRLTSTLQAGGLFHIAGTGDASWADLAAAVFEESARYGGPFASVVPITTAEFPTRARRPANSRLDSSAFSNFFGWTMPEWRKSVRLTVRELVGQVRP